MVIDPVNHSTLDLAIFSLNKIIIKAFDVCVPIKTFTPKTPPAPWMTHAIKKEINYRNKLRNYFRTFRTPYFFALLNTQRKLVNSLVTRARAEFIEKKLNTLYHEGNSRILWRDLKALGVVNSSASVEVSSFTPDEINDYFIKTVADISSTFRTTVLPIYPQSIFLPPTFEFLPITIDILSKLISRPLTNAAGVDNIPIHYIVKSSPTLLEDILVIINNSLRTATFPSL